MSDTTTTATIYTPTDTSGLYVYPLERGEVVNSTTELNNAETVAEVKDAVNKLVTAIQSSFRSFIEDQRTLHNNAVTTVADDHIATTQSNNTQTNEIINGVRAVTAPISEDARKARQALGDGILGRISDNVTNFTSSLKPILPSLQTFGIAFATTGLGAMFMTNALISAIKFIFNNPLMFIGSLIGGSILYNMFKEPIDNFITKISDKLKEWLSDILATALIKTVNDSAKTIEGLIDKFSSLNLSSDGLFKNINGSIEKLQKAIDDSWGKINKDINATIANIFDKHFPNAIRKFFEIFNEEIPKSIKVIDTELSKSTEFQKIINTADGVSTALNNVCTLYNNNKEQIDKLINTLDGNKDLLPILAKFFAPKPTTESVKMSDDEMGNIIIEDGDESDNSDNTPKNTTDITDKKTTHIINRDNTSSAQPSNDNKSKPVTNVFQKIITSAVDAAKDKIKSRSLSEWEQLRINTETAVRKHVETVNDNVKIVEDKIGDGKEKLNNIGKKIEELTNNFKNLTSYLQSFMGKQSPESSSTNVFVTAKPNNTSTGKRPQSREDGL